MVNESKERLLAAAKELFLARGYAGTTVDAICEKSELTKGSFYHFFQFQGGSRSRYIGVVDSAKRAGIGKRGTQPNR